MVRLSVESLHIAPAWEAERVGKLATLLRQFAPSFPGLGRRKPRRSSVQSVKLSNTGFGTMPPDLYTLQVALLKVF